MTTISSVRINEQRFWSTVEASSEIGTIPATAEHGAGLSRLTLTDADKTMRDLFVSWCEDAGLRVTVDRMGNIFARRGGLNDALSPIMLGSHLDTQETGGRFDGVLGVLGALEVVRTLNDAKHVTRRPIEIVNWTNEEGGRFPPPMVASGCFAGVYDVEWAHALVDDGGIRLGDELARLGYLGTSDVGRQGTIGIPAAYLELHIEQAPILDRERVQVGIVTHAFSVDGFRMAFHGATAHAGTRPMELRQNALVAAARLATAVDDIGQEFSASGGMATAVRITAFPNKAGIISSEAEFVCDVHHADPEIAASMADRVRGAALDAGSRTNCQMEIKDTWQWGGHIFDEEIVDALQDTAEHIGASHRDIASQAGHDAYFMARICPTAMIFTPCREGITHHPDEYTTLEETAPGINVLLHTAISLADCSD
ncbi:MAG: Zn-dependent hydrolase [Thermomicrobiales bacterium]